MSVKPQQYAIYKGMGGKYGAVQFNFQAPHFYHPETKEKDFVGTKASASQLRWKIREGAVFVDITSVKSGEKNSYDWDNKVTVALSVNDLGKVVYFLKTGKDSRGDSELKLLHDPGAKSDSSGKVQKHIMLTSPNGIAKGFMLNIAQVIGKERKAHSVPVSGDETMILATLFQTAIARALAW